MYIILCKFGGHTPSSLGVIGGGPQKPPPPVPVSQKIPVWIGLSSSRIGEKGSVAQSFFFSFLTSKQLAADPFRFYTSLP
jgi:hypothetical protein